MTDSAVDYLATLSIEQEAPFRQLLTTIRENIDPGLMEVATPSPAFVVPLSAFPDGYHCTPGKPLPYISLVAQKTGITLHHFGLYMNPEITAWFVESYMSLLGRKPDMGKGCIRFKKSEDLPFKLIGQLIAKQNMQEFVEGYENALSRSKNKHRKRAAT